MASGERGRERGREGGRVGLMMFVNRERAKIQREKGGDDDERDVGLYDDVGEAKSGPALKFITESTCREPFL